MTEQIREQLSAFLDDELPDSETDLLLKRLERDASLRQTLSRFVLVGEIMRGPVAVGPGRDLAARVAAAVEAEAPVAVPAARGLRIGTRAWARTAAGLAVAAGVATVAVFNVRVDTGGGSTSPQLAGDTSRPVLTTVEPSSYVVPAAASTLPMVPAARLTNYVFAHSEYSSPLGRRNVLSGILADDGTLESADVDEPDAPESPAGSR